MQAIICPSIEVSESMQYNIDDAFTKIAGRTGIKEQPTVYITKNPSGNFVVKFQVHHHGEDLFAEEEGGDFANVLLAAKRDIIRIILKKKGKVIRQAKHGLVEKNEILRQDALKKEDMGA